MSNSLLLKILSGPHHGAEVVLIDEHYRIGRGDDCDLVLDDPHLAEQHASLSLRDGQVFFESLEGNPVFLDGTAVESGELPLFQCLTVGSTHLACGPVDDIWPQIRLPEISPKDENKEEVEDTEKAGANEEPESTNGTVTSETTEASLQRRDRNRYAWILSLASFAMFAVVGLFFAFGMAGSPSSTDARSVANLDDLQRIVDRIAPQSTVKVVLLKDEYRAAGHVLEKNTATKLSQALLEAKPTIDTRDIWDTESIAENIRGFLKMRNLHAALTVDVGDEPGHVVVSGVHESSEDWDKARIDIETKTRVRKLIHDGVMTRTTGQKNGEEEEKDDVPKKPDDPAQKPPKDDENKSKPKNDRAKPPFKITSVTPFARSKCFRVAPDIVVTENSYIYEYYVKSILEDRILLVKEDQEIIVWLNKSLQP